MLTTEIVAIPLDGCPVSQQTPPILDVQTSDINPIVEIPKHELWKKEFEMCSLVAFERQNLIFEYQDANNLMQTKQWQEWMLKDDLDEARKTISRTIDPFTKKLLKASGEKVVGTMPKSMVQWLRATSLYYYTEKHPQPI